MARAPDPREKEAIILYKNGLKLVEIAQKLNVPDGTIRRWKSEHNWDGNGERSEMKSERSEKEKKQSIENDVEDISENCELTEKQKLFCLYFVRYFNATKAYQKAYGVDYKIAASNAHRLTDNDGIKAEIQRLKQNRLNRELLSEADIFQKYMDIAFADLTDFIEFGREEVPVMGPFGPLVEKKTKKPITKIVNTVKFKESSEIDGTLLAEVKQGRDGASIKLHDRMKALEWLADHMDLATAEQRARIAALNRQSGGEPDKDETGVVVLPPVLPETDEGIVEGGDEDG